MKIIKPLPANDSLRTESPPHLTDLTASGLKTI